MPAALRILALIVALASVGASATAPDLDPAARRWVERTRDAMTMEEKAGQLVMAAVDTTYLSTDTEAYEKVAALVRDRKVGGLIVFGGTEPMPPVLLNPSYGTVVLGDPLSAASTLNHLQRLARVPLLTAGDFEFGVGMRIRGAIQLPRAMAFGAAGDERLTEEAGRMTAAEMRGLGVHVNFAPVADVNNNPRNPVINTRSFGEDPALVGRLASAYVKGIQSAGVMATLKHFPGHGDTDTDSHLGLPIIKQPRERLEHVELPPFKAGIAAGVGAVSSSAQNQGSSAPGHSASISGATRCTRLRSWLASRRNSVSRSSSAWESSRSCTTTGSSWWIAWNAPGSVRNESASTAASRRSSLAPATVCRSRKRSSCFGFTAKTSMLRARHASTSAPRGVSIATAICAGVTSV